MRGLTLWIEAPADGSTWQAPAAITLMAGVSVTGEARPGDTITVDFFANAAKLGSGKAVWHGEVKPDLHSRNFQSMVMVAAGFSGADFIWPRPRPGTYTLTARASGLSRLPVVSAPVCITILPRRSQRILPKRNCDTDE